MGKRGSICRLFGPKAYEPALRPSWRTCKRPGCAHQWRKGLFLEHTRLP